VTGPGRSGAIASAYASHILGIPWIPDGARVPAKLWPVLVIDTAAQTGRTLRKAVRRTGVPEDQVCSVAVYAEPTRLRFWFEEPFAHPYLAIKREKIAGTAAKPKMDSGLLTPAARENIDLRLRGCTCLFSTHETSHGITKIRMSFGTCPLPEHGPYAPCEAPKRPWYHRLFEFIRHNP